MTRQSLQTRLNDLMEYTAKVEEERDELKSCVQAVLEKSKHLRRHMKQPACMCEGRSVSLCYILTNPIYICSTSQ